ncbi:MAG: diguanylate cyclase [Chloroflexi bacterium]|nr:diguanylate cyclase [Chloroflexota bacterium]
MPSGDVVAVVAALALGAVLGALGFSLVVGGHRASLLAELADRLARATDRDAVAAPIHYPDPRISRSLTSLAARIASVEAMAMTDPLTRLTNRQASLRTLTDEVARANRYERALSVVLIDIDHFKRVNDTHGHAVGDAVLRHVADVLTRAVRSTDTLGRYGGEEFIVVMPETDVDGGLASAENLRREVARAPFSENGITIDVTISVGLTGRVAKPSLDVDELLRRADTALYTAKAQGRDQVQPFREPDDDAGIIRATIDLGARRRAQDIGRAAFAASSRHLLAALSERQAWSGGASRLIADLAGDLATAVGLPEGDVDRVRTASLLHDLGKLAIPDEILDKPAPLTPREWRTIVEHPKIGQVVLEQAGAIRDAASIVLHHHEWFDGRGYPYGLAGAEIPLGSRIVAIADAYEAMISNRPYKAAISHAEALAELRREAGSQFDPALVNVFIDLYAKGVARGTPSRVGARSRRS